MLLEEQIKWQTQSFSAVIPAFRRDHFDQDSALFPAFERHKAHIH